MLFQNFLFFKHILFCTYLHGNGQFLLNIYQLYLTLWKITSKQSGVYSLLFGRRRDGTHFGRSRLSVRGSGRVCPGSRGSWRRFTLTGTLEAQGAVLQALTLFKGVRFIAWHPFWRECRRDPRHFWECRACLYYSPAPGPTWRRPCAIPPTGWWDGR